MHAMSRFDEIGMSQRVRLEWLEHTAQLTLAGLPRPEVEAELQAFLRDKLSIGGTAVRGNREKVITILLRTWVDVDNDLEPLRDDGLGLLRDLPTSQHLAVHWAMLMAAYPFWGQVAETVGRLLRLQGHVGAAEVQRRMRELRGERETVARAARRVLRAFHDWGVLVDSARKGVYVASPRIGIDDAALAAFVAEAWLRGQQSERAPVAVVVDSPALFPVVLSLPSLQPMRGGPRLDFGRDGSGELLIGLRKGAPDAVFQRAR